MRTTQRSKIGNYSHLAAATVAVMVVMASSTLGDLVQVDFLGVQKSSNKINLPGLLENATGGAMLFRNHGTTLPFGDNAEFISFCIELSETISTSGNPHTYNVVSTPLAPNSGPMGAQRANMMSAWFGQFWQGEMINDWTQTTATAFQLGVWEILYEDLDDVGSVSAGIMRVADNSGSAALVARQQADDWFSIYDPLGPSRPLLALSSPSGGATKRLQDQVTIIPEPATLLILSVGGLLLIRRPARW